jgi:chromosome segregation ATPase
MALTGSAQSNDGKRPPAGQTALSRRPPDAAISAPRIPSTAVANKQASVDGDGRIHLLTDRDSTAVNLAALQQQLAERSAAMRLLNRHVETLTARVSAAAAKIAERDNELDLAREELVHRDNENHSLQRSVELTTADNARLSKRLAASEAAVGKAYVDLERMKAALIAAERECAKTASAVDRADQKRRNETGSLQARLEAMASCAATADQLLAGLRQNLRDKLELLQNLLAVKDRQLDELKQSRSKLLERTGKLLEAFKARDGALAAAEERNRALEAHMAQIEAATAKRHKSLAARLTQAGAALRRNDEEIKSIRFELQDERKKRRAAEAACDELCVGYAALQRKLDGVGTTENDFSGLRGPHSADMLLATTISL